VETDAGVSAMTVSSVLRVRMPSSILKAIFAANVLWLSTVAGTDVSSTPPGEALQTIEDGQKRWDGIVFGELAPGKWMAGSDTHARSQKQQTAWPAETADAETLVQVALVYRGEEAVFFRDGEEYWSHPISQPPPFDSQSTIIIGPRHLGNSDFFAGAAEDARIYDRALTGGELAALQPNVEGAIKPWAWWSFDDEAATDKTGRFPHTRLVGAAKVGNSRLILDGNSGSFHAASFPELLPTAGSQPKSEPKFEIPEDMPEEMLLNFHLMHPGGASFPGDPNTAFHLDGIYHLYYILAYPWQGKKSYSFVHITSPDMLHWTWQPTKLQPSFTGHGMFSGTGFITKEGKPAAIYNGQGTGRNHIVIAKNNQLSEWEEPYPIEVRDGDGNKLDLPHGDPDLFRIGDTYYAIACRFGGNDNPPLIKSTDLKNWTHVGDFIKEFPPDVLIGEDISCANFFPIGDKWMLLAISHSLGCRYFIGEWDSEAEQFVPEQHGRMNWRREDEDKPFSKWAWRDFFAPESVLTPDGRRVMWAWLDTLHPSLHTKSIQSLPRELSLPADGILRIKPLRELESLRTDPVVREDVVVPKSEDTVRGKLEWHKIAELPGDSAEIRITIARDQAARKRFGFRLFGDGTTVGLPIIVRPETGTIRVGSTEAPFAVADLPAGEDVELRIFVDKYIVEVFANDRQAVAAAEMNWKGKPALEAYSFGAPTTLGKLELWKLRPANQGLLAARASRVWEPRTE
jgi:beta-fructofuranosidase